MGLNEIADRLFFTEERLGRYGKPIRITKVRTMEDGAEARWHDVVGSNGGVRPDNDPRVTLIGKLLRRYWFDEVPQIIDVLRGRLALIGIRPMPAKEWGFYNEELKHRVLRFKPGLIGVQYAADDEVKTMEDSARIMQGYLDNVESLADNLAEIPASIDFESIAQDIVGILYLVRFLHNVVMKGVRGR